MASLPSNKSLEVTLDQLEASLGTSANINELTEVLHRIESTQDEADQLLRQFSTKRSTHHHAKVRALEMNRMDLSSTLERSRALKKKVGNASALSAKITEKVRLLDAEKLRIDTTKTYVEGVITLKTEIQKAEEYIRHEQWKEAAQSVDVIRQLPEGLIDDSFVESVVPTSAIPDMPKELLASWVAQLKDRFVSEFNEAAKTRNVQRLTYFFQLFPLIGEKRLGLDCYSRFICSIISEQSRAILKGAGSSHTKSADFYARILFQLYQTIAGIVNQHSRIIKRYYGSAVMPDILAEIQNECDLQSGLIFDTFWDVKQLDGVVDRVKQYSYPVLVDLIYRAGVVSPPGRASEDKSEAMSELATPSLATIGLYTDEISAMMNHWAMYCKFFVVTWNESLVGEHGTRDPEHSVYPRPLLVSPFMGKIAGGVTVNFDLLGTFAVRRTIEKACEIEQVPSIVPQLAQCVKYLTELERDVHGTSANNSTLHSLAPEEAPFSSMVEDVTMSLNVILTESLSTGQLASIKSMISNVKRILENDFLNIMKRRLAKNSPGTNATLLSSKALEEVREYLQAGNTRVKTAKRSKSPPPSDVVSRGTFIMQSINAAISLANEEEFGGDGTTLTDFIIVLNSLSTFETYLARLSERLVENLKTENLLILDDQDYSRVAKELEKEESSPHLMVNIKTSHGTEEKPSVQDRIETIIKSLSSGFSEKTDALLDARIALLFNQTLRPRLGTLLNDTFPSDAYMASSETLPSDLNGVSAGIISFIQHWNRLTLPYLTTMTKQNFSLLMEKLISFIAGNLESKLWEMDKRCNESGTATLERDVSVLISEITKYDYGLRDEFTRVTQIIMLMGMDEDEDIDDLRDMDWALTPTERRRAKNLRSDRLDV